MRLARPALLDRAVIEETAVNRIRSIVVGAIVSLAPIVTVTPTADAATQVPFTITENIDFNTGVQTFTATGPLCESGTFVDDVRVFAGAPNQPKANLLIRTVYTCDDGSGTFKMTKHVFLKFGETSSSNTGPVCLHGGTGAYTGLSGHGIDIGTASNGIGLGLIAGVVLQH